VFSSVLAWKDGDVVAEEPPRAFSPEAAADRARAAHQRGDLVVGEVVEQFAPGIAFRDPATDLPDAGVIATIAAKRLAATTHTQGIEAVYGREPDVTRATPRRATDGLDSATNVGSSGRSPA